MTELVFRDDAYARRCAAEVTAVGPDGIRLDRTVFYPMGGGQPGDTGVLHLTDGSTVTITDARKGASLDDVVHIAADGATLPDVGSTVEAEIDWERRYRHMRMHTCMHLLTAVIDAPVTGGQLSADKGRLDFDLPTLEMDKAAIAERLNALIAEDRPVAARWIDDDALAAQPELVRTMKVKPPMGQGRVRLMEVEGVDVQPCGGTHVARTGEIGSVLVRKIESKGKQNRRISLGFADG